MLFQVWVKFSGEFSWGKDCNLSCETDDEKEAVAKAAKHYLSIWPERKPAFDGTHMTVMLRDVEAQSPPRYYGVKPDLNFEVTLMEAEHNDEPFKTGDENPHYAITSEGRIKANSRHNL